MYTVWDAVNAMSSTTSCLKMLLCLSRLSRAILYLLQHIAMANLYIEGVSIFQILLDKEITLKLPSIQRIGGIKKDWNFECVSQADPGS